MQGRGAEATGQGGWAENKLHSGVGEESLRKTGSPVSFSLSGTQFPMHWEEPERRGLTCCPAGFSGTCNQNILLPSFSLK